MFWLCKSCRIKDSLRSWNKHTNSKVVNDNFQQYCFKKRLFYFYVESFVCLVTCVLLCFCFVFCILLGSLSPLVFILLFPPFFSSLGFPLLLFFKINKYADICTGMTSAERYQHHSQCWEDCLMCTCLFCLLVVGTFAFFLLTVQSLNIPLSLLLGCGCYRQLYENRLTGTVPPQILRSSTLSVLYVYVFCFPLRNLLFPL